MTAGTRRTEGVADRLRPLVHQGSPLASFPRRVEAALERARAGESRWVVVLAVDGLGVEIARRQWTPDRLVELATTVPSASAPAWLTAMSGTGVGEHLVAGMVFAGPGRDGLVNAVTTRHGDPGAGTLVRRGHTVFERARSRGLGAVAHPGVLAGWPGPWLDALLAGAQPGGRPRGPGTDPVAEARGAVADVDATLGDHDRAPALVWAYVDIDTAVHRRGYDGDALAAVALLGGAAERWARGGAEVLAVSDHGLTPVERDPGTAAAWEALDRAPLCRMPAGGAGRTRWLYAAPGRQGELLERARDALGDVAVVATPEELAGAGAVDLGAGLRPRLGDAVAIATDPRFPVPDPDLRWEHGALTPEEMLVPCASWGPAGTGGAGEE